MAASFGWMAGRPVPLIACVLRGWSNDFCLGSVRMAYRTVDQRMRYRSVNG